MDDLDRLIEAVERAGARADVITLASKIWASDNVMASAEAAWADKAANGSLDAAKALHDALLPGWGWMLGNKGTSGVIPPEKMRFENGTVGPVCRIYENPARAWLLAVLKAYRQVRNG